jgi:lysylphosphatidylglycerol synthetase-like protein (DUF2156 family)
MCLIKGAFVGKRNFDFIEVKATTLNISYNLFANVETILYSHTMIVLRIYYKDTKHKEQVYMQMTQKYEQFQLQLLLCVIIKFMSVNCFGFDIIYL